MAETDPTVTTPSTTSNWPRPTSAQSGAFYSAAFGWEFNDYGGGYAGI
jgi:hypothetical protein